MIGEDGIPIRLSVSEKAAMFMCNDQGTDTTVSRFLRSLSYYDLVELFYGFPLSSACEPAPARQTSMSWRLQTTIVQIEDVFSILDLPATANHEDRRRALRLAVSLELGQRLGLVAEYECDGLASEEQTWMRWEAGEQIKFGVRRA